MTVLYLSILSLINKSCLFTGCLTGIGSACPVFALEQNLRDADIISDMTD